MGFDLTLLPNNAFILEHRSLVKKPAFILSDWLHLRLFAPETDYRCEVPPERCPSRND